MSTTCTDRGRRLLLKRSVDVFALVVVAAAASDSPEVAAKAAKSEFQYQEYAHDGKTCGQCKFYSSEGPGQPAGTCSIVDGPISRDGWCKGFAPKGLA